MLSETTNTGRLHMSCWTEDRKKRTADYISGMLVGYCVGMIVGVWIL